MAAISCRMREATITTRRLIYFWVLATVAAVAASQDSAATHNTFSRNEGHYRTLDQYYDYSYGDDTEATGDDDLANLPPPPPPKGIKGSGGAKGSPNPPKKNARAQGPPSTSTITQSPPTSDEYSTYGEASYGDSASPYGDSPSYGEDSSPSYGEGSSPSYGDSTYGDSTYGDSTYGGDTSSSSSYGSYGGEGSYGGGSYGGSSGAYRNRDMPQWLVALTSPQVSIVAVIFICACCSWLGMFWTAYQFHVYPEGNYANCCRLSLSTAGCVSTLCYYISQGKWKDLPPIATPFDDDEDDDEENTSKMKLRPRLEQALDVEHGKIVHQTLRDLRTPAEVARDEQRKQALSQPPKSKRKKKKKKLSYIG